MFACMSEGVQPDVMTLAKALGGGLMPIGAMLCTASAYTESFALRHSSTFAANTLACRAGLAALQMLTRDDNALVRRVKRNGARLKDGLLELQRRYPQVIAEVHGRGFLLGIRFAGDRRLWPESLLGVALEQEFFTPLFASYMLNVEGVRVAPTLNGKSVIRIEPALTMTWPQCERLLSALERTLALFATGDTGRILASIIEGQPQPLVWATPPEKPWVQVKPRPAERRFAFLMHPLDYGNAVDFDSSLAYLDDRSLEEVVRKVSGLVDPFVVEPWPSGRENRRDDLWRVHHFAQDSGAARRDAEGRCGRLCPRRTAPGPRPRCRDGWAGCVYLGRYLGRPSRYGRGSARHHWQFLRCRRVGRGRSQGAGPGRKPRGQPPQYRHPGSDWCHWSSHGADAGRGRGPAYAGRQSRFIEQPCPRTAVGTSRRRG